MGNTEISYRHKRVFSETDANRCEDKMYDASTRGLPFCYKAGRHGQIIY